MSRRAINNIIYASALRVALFISLSILVFLIGSIIWQGGRSISPSFFFTEAKNFGASGGILYQIIGSLILIAVAAILVLPFAIGTAIFRSEYVVSPKLGRRIDLAIFSLNGIPSIT